jgi:hypothetical protein
MAPFHVVRSRGLALVTLLLVPLLPSVATAAGWGDENWGAMVWGGASPVVPAMPIAALLALAGLLALAAGLLLRARSRSQAVGRWTACALAAALVATPGTASATSITVPYSFSNGTVADATEVNANFGTLVSESNAQDGRLGTLETGLSAHAADASAHHTKTTSASELTTGELSDNRLSGLVSLLGASIEVGELGFDPATQTELNVHAASASVHHARYSDAEAVAAVAAADAYVQNSGDTVNGQLSVTLGSGYGTALMTAAGDNSTAFSTTGIDSTARGTSSNHAGSFSAGSDSTAGWAYGIDAEARGTSFKWGGRFFAGSDTTAGFSYGVEGRAFGINEKYGGLFVAGNGSGFTAGAATGVTGEAQGTTRNVGGYFLAGSSLTSATALGVEAKAFGTGEKRGGQFTAGSDASAGTAYGVEAFAYGSEGKLAGRFIAGTDSTSGMAYGVYGSAHSSDDTKYGGYFYAASAGTGTSYGVHANGGTYDFYAQGPGIDFGTSSSIRWKQNVQPLGDALAMVGQLRGVRFDWDAEHGGKHDVGMIAEEVGEVLPEIVVYEANGVDAAAMDYSKLTPLLVEAVNALAEENRALKQQLAELEARFAKEL